MASLSAFHSGQAAPSSSQSGSSAGTVTAWRSSSLARELSPLFGQPGEPVGLLYYFQTSVLCDGRFGGPQLGECLLRVPTAQFAVGGHGEVP